MADEFSWSDGVQAALSSCLPCLTRASADSDSETSHLRRRATPEAPSLRGLLEGASDTDTDAETLSLHSTFGTDANRRRRTRRKDTQPKGIRIMGWDLFGRRVPPIQLEGDERSLSVPEPSARRRPRAPGLLSASTTLDSDAAPLDPATIESLSQRTAASDDAARPAAAEEERRVKEERRRWKRERKELKRAALALSQHETGDGGFEGFQGSGDLAPGNPSAYFDPAPHIMPHSPGDDDEDADAADFDAGAYTRRTAAGSSAGGSSDSRSRTSASVSNPGDPPRYSAVASAPKPRRSRSGSQASYPHGPPPPLSPPSARTPKARRSKTRPKTVGSDATSASGSGTTEQSAPLASPVHGAFPSPALVLASPVHGGFEGFPDDAGFPSVGFGLARGPAGGKGRGQRDAGAFLARRGDE